MPSVSRRYGSSGGRFERPSGRPDVELAGPVILMVSGGADSTALLVLAATSTLDIDDGRGTARIARERLPHLFDKFYRIPTGDLHAVKGFGLGLYYVRTVAERHGGSARAESGDTGRGSKFFIIIPRYGRE